MPLAAMFHHSQLPAMPYRATMPVTTSGVSAANVVATIDVPASHHGTSRPERKRSIVPPPQTRLVRSTKYRSRSGSIQSDVPVKPTWPNAEDDIRVPHDEAGSIVSQPSARELPGTVLFVVNSRTSSAEKGGGMVVSPRAARSIVRANRPTAGAEPKSPAWPAIPPSAAA